MDLAPASWIWFPSRRTLPNTFVLFRKTLHLGATPTEATGWITADSRYRLTVNGTRIQWGPAPCDPRSVDVDPADLAPHLRAGENVIGVEVLYYGLGEGTWVAGKPGLLCHFEIVDAHGQRIQLVSDESWLAFLDRGHRPGQYKRWFLRALQEEFDARLHPHGWAAPAFAPDSSWLPAMRIAAPADKPSSCGHYYEYLGSDTIPAATADLHARAIPLLREFVVPALRLAESGRVTWSRDPLDWFEFRTPNAFEIAREPVILTRDQQPTTKDEQPAATGPETEPDSETAAGPWSFVLGPSPQEAVYLTFEFAEQLVGWPLFTIDAPAGTIVELITQESHDPAHTAWLDSHFYSWSRFVCREGRNRFEAFDFESLRWLQLHIRVPDMGREARDSGFAENDHQPAASLQPPASHVVVVRDVGVRRRVFPWPNQARIACGDPALGRLFDAAINTLHNCAQETCVDGMGRERQQYSGDGGHQLAAIRYAFGETRLPRRFLDTFGMGLTTDGYFLDCWPGYDRLARLMQRQVGATSWGPLLDHGVGFGFDCWQHYLETGDHDAVRAALPRLLRFAAYLERLRGDDGLLPVENLGVPAVWIDHEAYRQQRHKQCAFNLYVAAMLRHALAPLCQALGELDAMNHYVKLSESIKTATVARFWDAQRGLFVANRPWLDTEGAPALCDRSLATALLFDQCPDGATGAALRVLAEAPPELGLSYPANAVWRYRALAHLGRIDAVLADFRARWATMDSVLQNNTIQEYWQARPDSGDQWSHCAIAPLLLLFEGIAGITPEVPGFAHCRVRPQLGDLASLALIAHTVRGPIHLHATRASDRHHATLMLPPGCAGELLLPVGATAEADGTIAARPDELHAFQVPPNTAVHFSIPIASES
jgi:hypothetical protein